MGGAGGGGLVGEGREDGVCGMVWYARFEEALGTGMKKGTGGSVYWRIDIANSGW